MREEIPRARGVAAETHHYSSQVESFRADWRPSPRVSRQSHVDGTLEIPRQKDDCARPIRTVAEEAAASDSNECGGRKTINLGWKYSPSALLIDIRVVYRRWK